MNEQAGQPTTPDDEFEQYEALRPLMFSIAYRMLGSVGEAEDIVQEAFLRLHRARSRGAIVESPKAFLTTATTRLAIDSLRSARARHEAYVGYWLPEPVAVSLDPDPADLAEKNDSLSLAFLVLLQTLSPVERAVFLLREVFDYDYDEIATTVQKSEDNCRQIFARAKRRIDAGKPRFEANPHEHIELARRFFDAAVDGDMASLLKFLAAEAGFYGDGGGKAHAYPAPVFGQHRVALIFRSLMKSAQLFNVTFRLALVNGQLGAASFDADGRLINVLALDISGGVIQTVRAIVNPDKLTHLGLPVSDLARMKPREP